MAIGLGIRSCCSHGILGGPTWVKTANEWVVRTYQVAKKCFWNGSLAVPMQRGMVFYKNYHSIELQVWPCIWNFSIFLFVKKQTWCCICLVSIWWRKYWTKNNKLWLPPKPRSQTKDCGRSEQYFCQTMVIINIAKPMLAITCNFNIACLKFRRMDG